MLFKGAGKSLLVFCDQSGVSVGGMLVQWQFIKSDQSGPLEISDEVWDSQNLAEDSSRRRKNHSSFPYKVDFHARKEYILTYAIKNQLKAPKAPY